MQISTILAHIDSGFIALPEFQRGFVWNRERVRGLFDSLYRRHPVGGLLVWTTDRPDATLRGGGERAPGPIKLLLDGQQRMTTLYGVVRGRPPRFFDGDAKIITGLRFHLEQETFEFHQPVKMQDDPLWVDVSALMREGVGGLGRLVAEFSRTPEYAARVPDYTGRLAQLLGVTAVDLHVEEVTGKDKSPDVVVDIFNRVNSGGTKLSKGDLALARIGADWPGARSAMQKELKRWNSHGYEFTLDWLLRSVNTVLTGEAKFNHLHDKGADDVQDGLKRAVKQIDNCLNRIAGHLGLDHDRVLFGRFGIPVMVRYLDRSRAVSPQAWGRLLFWFAQAGMWGRFSASTETAIDQSLAALDGAADDGIDGLLEDLRQWSGARRVKPEDFTGWSLGARFYPVLYMLTRVGEARDLLQGIPLKRDLLGKLAQLEIHHIFPKARLYERGHGRPEVNALANYCLQTKETNARIGARRPEEYFRRVEELNPGALASQWIPDDSRLWKLENYPDFLEARRALLAAEANRRFDELLGGAPDAPGAAGVVPDTAASALPVAVSAADPAAGGLGADSEEAEVASLNDWMEAQRLPRGTAGFELADETTGEQVAMLDLAWPDGVQAGLSGAVAVLLNEPVDVLASASRSGYRCFTTAAAFRAYVDAEILGGEAGDENAAASSD